MDSRAHSHLSIVDYTPPFYPAFLFLMCETGRRTPVASLYGAKLLQFGADESETMGMSGYKGSQEAAVKTQLSGILALPL